MSHFTTLTADDGHQLSAYVARPAAAPLAGLVVVQEIFGVNAHIRSVADGYARDGFFVVAPALFDRVERGVELGYEGADMQRALSLMPKLSPENAVKDISAAIAYAAQAPGKKVSVIGYCFGGTLAWITAARLPVSAAVGYYGGRIGTYAAETPKAPVMLHFGKQDTHIPREDVEKVHAAHPEVEIYWYDAGHGFNCDARSAFEPVSAKQARERSLAFLKKHLE
jgi:carboxymethylenebutenolidase